MIRAQIHRDGDGRVSGFHVHGHALAGEPGHDLVCAAVSAVTQTALMGLEDWCGLDVDAVVAKGDLRVSLPPDSAAAEAVQAILETMVLGLKAVAAGHGQRIRIIDGS